MRTNAIVLPSGLQTGAPSVIAVLLIFVWLEPSGFITKRPCPTRAKTILLLAHPQLGWKSWFLVLAEMLAWFCPLVVMVMICQISPAWRSNAIVFPSGE